MNSFKSSIILSVFLLSSQTFAISDFKLVTFKPEVLEVSASYPPGVPGFESTRPTVVLPPQKTFSQFGGLTKDHSFTAEMQKNLKIELNKNALIKNAVNLFTPRPICGGSPYQNTLNCFDLNRYGQFLQSYPIPGSVSSTPVFYDNFWLIGTAKGFLLKVQANPDNKYLPQLGKENTSLWGNYSRKYMNIFRPKTIYKDNENIQNQNDNKIQLTLDGTPGLKWIFANSAKFVGTPLIKNNKVFILSDSGYVQALDWNTGKLIWAVRLSPDLNLKITSNALKFYNDELIVGNDLGMILFLNPNNGHVIWSWRIPEATDTQRESYQLPAAPDKFSGIVAPPLVLDNGIIVSNAESMTQFISAGIKSSVWSYPAGSVAEAKQWKNNIILGSTNGEIISLNKSNGELNWKTRISENLSPVISLFIAEHDVTLAVLNNGQVFMIDNNNGKILAQNLSIGEVNGEFFAGYDNAKACISFAQNGFRCFYPKVQKTQ